MDKLDFLELPTDQFPSCHVDLVRSTDYAIFIPRSRHVQILYSP